MLFAAGGRLLLEVDEDRELLLQDARRMADSVLGPHTAVGMHLEGEPVVVRPLPHARVGHREVHLEDGREDRVDRDGPRGVLLALVPLGRDVAASHPDGTRCSA